MEFDRMKYKNETSTAVLEQAEKRKKLFSAPIDTASLLKRLEKPGALWTW